MSTGNLRDPDDFFADTRMSFGDHIEDLRRHLLRAIAGFLIALVGSFFIGGKVLDYIAEPARAELRRYYDRRAQQAVRDLDTDQRVQEINRPTPFTRLTFRKDQLDALFKGKTTEEVERFKRPYVSDRKKAPGPEEPSSWWSRFLKESAFARYLVGAGEAREEKPDPNAEEIAPDDLISVWVRHDEPVREAANHQQAMRFVGEFDNLTSLNPTEVFMVYFKICLLCGVVIGSPWIFYQIWAFIAAGLYPHEKRLVHVYLPFSLGLFLAGVFLCELLVIPRALEALLWFNEWLGFKPDIRLNEWLSFAILLPLVFGVSFQTPLVMMFVAKLGILSIETFRGYRRIAWFLMAVFAAIITPTPDAVTMLFLWVPMAMLFELGILLVQWTPKRSRLDFDDTEENAFEV